MTKYRINVPQAAKIMGKNQMWLRMKIKAGDMEWAEYGDTGTGYPNIYIYPKKFIMATGATKDQMNEVTGIDWSDYYKENFGLTIDAIIELAGQLKVIAQN